MWLQWLYNVNCFFLIRNFCFCLLLLQCLIRFLKSGICQKGHFCPPLLHFSDSQSGSSHLEEEYLNLFAIFQPFIWTQEGFYKKKFYKKIADTGEIRGCWKAEFTQHWATEGRWNWKGNTKLRPFGYINLSLADR